MTRPITYGLEPYRKDPGQLVQSLPSKRWNGTALGHLIAFAIGATAAVLLLAWEAWS